MDINCSYNEDCESPVLAVRRGRLLCGEGLLPNCLDSGQDSLEGIYDTRTGKLENLAKRNLYKKVKPPLNSYVIWFEIYGKIYFLVSYEQGSSEYDGRSNVYDRSESFRSFQTAVTPTSVAQIVVILPEVT